MPIENRTLAAGTRVVAKYKGQTWEAIVLPTDPPTYGLLGEPRLANQAESYKSLSAAGSAIMGGIACNGWRFWSVEGEAHPLDPATGDERDTSVDRKPAKARAAFKVIKRTPNQKGVAEGQVRYFCSACMNGFTANEGETPDHCPQGHSNDDAELTSPVAAGAV